MTNKEAIYCMRSYLGETDCVKCPYYGSIPIDERTSVCRSSEAHTLAIKALTRYIDAMEDDAKQGER